MDGTSKSKRRSKLQKRKENENKLKSEEALIIQLLSKNLKVRIYKTVILPVLLYGCETWTLTLREEHRLSVFENKVLRKIFGAKRDEVTGEWRKLHSTELHALYSSPDIIRNIKSRRLRWAGDVARMGESRNAYRVLVGRPEGKKPLGRPRRRWEDNIKMDLREVGYDDRDWINLAQDRDRWRAYVRAAMNLQMEKPRFEQRIRETCQSLDHTEMLGVTDSVRRRVQFILECTPVKHLVPQAHSTPLSCNVVTASPTEDEVQIISDDEEEEMHYAFKFQCTQDTLDVDWDDSPKRKPSKILGIREALVGKKPYTSVRGLRECATGEDLIAVRTVEEPFGVKP
ncbi:hypothetical protein ANN_23706 [Periplaneta americana]|uniref:Uncharacterized protein n=1 Tax=Periplaneta americana TaxID=6978 RepID=A0ABQ8SLU8_PERAM|nr:hypothetical protein ANN_23706 [Periplaneta americana]